MKLIKLITSIIFLSGSVLANTSLLVGTVYDGNGAVITEVSVKAVDGTAKKFETITDGDGSYVLKLPFSLDANARYGSMNYVVSFAKPKMGFEMKVFRDFIFVSSTLGKMNLDCVLEGKYSEPIIEY